MPFDPENLANPDYLDECSFRELETSAYLPNEENNNFKSSFSDVTDSLDSQRDLWTIVVAARNAMKFLLHRSQRFYDSNDPTRYDRKQKKEDGSPMIPEDEEAQKIIVSTIKKQCPKDSFLAEEELDEEGENITRRWIVDGLDGTGDFIHSNRHFCCAIALAEKGSPALGVIINRMGDLFLTSRDRGAYFVGAPNPQFLKMQVSKKERIQTIQGITHSWVLKAIKKYHSNSKMSRYAQGLQFNPGEPDLLEEQWQSRTVWGKEEAGRSYSLETRRKICETRGSSSLQEAYLATGALDWYINGPLHPWDAAAGTLLIKEAGGKVTNWKGEKRKTFERGPILASNGLVHDQLVELMEPIVPPWE